jgi:quercetin dioxygenase-like cupin family protein
MTTEIQDKGGWGSGDTSYDLFVKREGVPVIRGLWVEDVMNLPLAPWQRLGGFGAYINLTGSGINTSYIAIDAYVAEVAPAESLKPERHVFEEIIYVLKGKGTTVVWSADGKEQRFDWREGALFAIPLNARHQIVNQDKSNPARIFACTFAPTMINLLHNEQFIFANSFDFTDRYAGEDNYFNGAGTFIDKRLLDVNFVEDIRGLNADGAVSESNSDDVSLLYVEMGCNTMSVHRMEFPVGTYAPAHRHEPGAHILILSGQGYSLHWLDDKEEPLRIDWKAGSVFAPPEQWYHQHFNSGPTPAKYIAFKPRGRKFRTKGKFMNNVSQRQGGTLIEYADENPDIRALYERECARNGVTVNMRPVEAD